QNCLRPASSHPAAVRCPVTRAADDVAAQTPYTVARRATRPASAKMATASVWPSASRASDRSTDPRHAKAFMRAGVAPLPGRGSSRWPSMTRSRSPWLAGRSTPITRPSPLPWDNQCPAAALRNLRRYPPRLGIDTEPDGHMLTMSLLLRLFDRLERSEAIDRVGRPLNDAVHRAIKAGKFMDVLSGTWLGHPVHPMLVGVPIGAWVGASLRAATPRGAAGARSLVGFGVVVAAPSALCGIADWSDTTGS